MTTELRILLEYVEDQITYEKEEMKEMRHQKISANSCGFCASMASFETLLDIKAKIIEEMK